MDAWSKAIESGAQPFFQHQLLIIMSYLVLARRWRPDRFSEVVGQPHVIRTLLNSLRKGRIAHAYLFSGPRGIGKTTTARLLARALNCLQPEDSEPCGKCASCTAIAEGRFIDVLEIDAASNRGIDEIRQLRDGVRYAPIEGRVKIYIIDEVHMLTEQAFNALLKTLEEPPAHAYFCLATTDPQKVPATILSRCQRFDFRRVSIIDIRNHLEKICKKESIKYDIEALDLVARKADGSVRDSLSLLDQIIAFAEGRVLRKDVDDVLGEVRFDLYFRSVELAAEGTITDAFRLDEELAASGTDPQDFILGLEEHLVQILQVKSAGIENVDVPPDAIEEFKRASQRFAEADLIRLIQYCSTAEVDIRRRFNPRTRLQLLLLRFATMDSSVVLADLIEKFGSVNTDVTPVAPAHVVTPASTARVEDKKSVTHVSDKTQQMSLNNAQEKLEPADRESAEAGPDGETAKIAVPIPDDPLGVAQKNWDKICDRIALEHNSSGRLIKYDGYPVGYENGFLKIRFTSKYHLETARGCKQMLQSELSMFVGNVNLDFEVGELPERTVSESVAEEDPAVKLLMDRLGAQPQE